MYFAHYVLHVHHRLQVTFGTADVRESKMVLKKFVEDGVVVGARK
jgi:hypothetical protein